MSDALSMSLDDLIKSNSSRRGGRGGNRGGASRGRGNGRNNNNQRGGNQRSSGPIRNQRSSAGFRATPYSRPQQQQPQQQRRPARPSNNDSWQHDMFSGAAASRSAAPRIQKVGFGAPAPVSTKILLTNLNFEVTSDNLSEIFSEFGALKRAVVNFDRSGRSEGTGEVIFVNRADAEVAFSELQNANINDIPVTLTWAPAPAPRLRVTPAPQRLMPAPRRGRGAARVPTRTRGAAVSAAPNGQRRLRAATRAGASVRGGAGARGRGAARGRGGRAARTAAPKKSATDLDADLDSYFGSSSTETPAAAESS